MLQLLQMRMEDRVEQTLGSWLVKRSSKGQTKVEGEKDVAVVA